MDLFKGNQGKVQGGFTLIELLVVIGILAVLAAVAIPAYSRFFGEGELEANASELSNIQASMDAMMAHHRLLNVNAETTAMEYFHERPTATCSAGPPPVGCSNPRDVEFLHPAFLRIGSPATAATKMCYTWDIIGFVTQVARDGDGNC